MDIFSKKSGDYWATVAIETAADGTFTWQLRMALVSDPDQEWVVASGGGFEHSSAASAEGMEALILLETEYPSDEKLGIEDGRAHTKPPLH